MTMKENNITYCRKVVFSIVSLTIILVLVYSNSFHCSWHFDDMPNIVENPRLHMQKLDWESFKKALFSDRNNPHFPYRPVACLSFALNYYFGKLNVFGYHVVNLTIHLITAIFLFLFIYRTLEYLALTKRWTGDTYFVALLSTVLWAINPIQTQAVTYIVQRMAAMAAMFYIVGMYFYLLARTTETKAKRIAYYGWCTLSFLLALGSKENAAMFPASVFLYELLILQDDPWQFVRERWISFVIAIGLTLAIGVGYFLWKTGGLPDFTGGYKERPFTLMQRLLTETRVVIFYISLLFYPMPNRLCLTHNFTISTSILHPITTLFSILTILGLLAIATAIHKKMPLISFSIFFFFINHVIESTIFSLELVFEHRNYLPSVFMFVPIAMSLHYLLEKFSARKPMQFTISSFVILLFVGFGHSTFMRNFVWKNEKALWIDAVEKSPNLFRPHHGLAKYYQDSGQTDKAISEYQKALSSKSLARNKAKALTYYNLGLLYTRLNDKSKALSCYNSSIRIDPNFGPAWINLAAIFDEKGMPEKAVQCLNEALKRYPEIPTLTFNLGLICLRNGQTKRAISYFRKIGKNEPLHKEAVFYLAIAHEKDECLGLAALNFKKCINYHMRTLDACLHLAAIYEATSRRKEAEKYARTALNIMTADSTKKFKSKIRKLFTPNRRNKFLIPPRKALCRVLIRTIHRTESQLKSWEKFLSQISTEISE